jgi:hypothetical protein
MTLAVIPHRMTITMTLIRTKFVRMKHVRTTFNTTTPIRMTLRMTLIRTTFGRIKLVRTTSSIMARIKMTLRLASSINVT